MRFKDQYDSSFWNKSVFSVCILLTLFVTLWIQILIINSGKGAK